MFRSHGIHVFVILTSSYLIKSVTSFLNISFETKHQTLLIDKYKQGQ